MGFKVFRAACYSSRLLCALNVYKMLINYIQIRQNESHKITQIDIDHPTPVAHPNPDTAPPLDEPAITSLGNLVQPLAGPHLIRQDTAEWTSHAFLKHARVSYGSFFD